MLLQKGTSSPYIVRPIYCARRIKMATQRTYSELELVVMNGISNVFG